VTISALENFAASEAVAPTGWLVWRLGAARLAAAAAPVDRLKVRRAHIAHGAAFLTVSVLDNSCMRASFSLISRVRRLDRHPQLQVAQYAYWLR
jgi:hypothetical protein